MSPVRVGIELLYVYQTVSQAVSADWMVCNYQVSTDQMFQAYSHGIYAFPCSITYNSIASTSFEKALIEM